MKILLSTQVPCSAGTYITRYVADFIHAQALVPETNPWSSLPIGPRAFSPLFPAAPLVKTGILSQADCIECYEASIRHLLASLERRGHQRVVLRDHMFSEWFTGSHHTIPFWPEFLERSGINFKVLLSARNPFDSYLGLCWSFPEAARRLSLTDYAACYLSALKAYQEACSDLILLKIEELADSATSGASNPALTELSSWAGIQYLGAPSAIESQKWQTSGASGRSAEQPQRMPRRAFTNQLRTQALSSKPFKELQQCLGYPSEASYLSSLRVRAVSFMASSQQTLSTPLMRLPFLGARVRQLRWFVSQPQ